MHCYLSWKLSLVSILNVFFFYFIGQACISCQYLRKALLTQWSRVQRSVKTKLAKTESLEVAMLTSKLSSSECKMITPQNLTKYYRQRLQPCLPISKNVRQCFSAAKKRNSKGNISSNDWVLECILMKMKSARLYKHLRKHDIISLPIKSMVKRYLRICKSLVHLPPVEMPRQRSLQNF